MEKVRAGRGLRRFSACRELGMGHVPACIRDFGDERVAALALEENRFRKDLTQPELPKAVLRLRERDYTIERIAEIAGMNTAEVSVYLRVPEFPPEVREAFFSGEVTFSHLRALAGLGEKQMVELLHRIKAEGLSRQDAELIASTMRGKIELPDFFEPKQFMRLLGEHLEFRRGKRSLSLTVRASNEQEMASLLGKILRKEKLE